MVDDLLTCVAQKYCKCELTMLFRTGKRTYRNSLLPFKSKAGQDPGGSQVLKDRSLLSSVIE